MSRNNDATVDLAALLTWGRDQLGRVGLPPVEAEWLLKWVLETDSLVLAPRQVGIRAAEIYRSAIAQRRSHVPLQHITGEMQFRGVNLKAGPGVFSVRPETEMLVEYALQALPDAGKQKLIVDLCAGSGAVGLSLAAERAHSEVWLVEKSPKAMRYLRLNAEGLEFTGSTVHPVLGDALVALPELDGTVDLVVSNPPYVGIADSPTQIEALADPPMALFGGGEDGLVIPRGIIGRAYRLLKDGGTLVMEHGDRQGQSLRGHAKSVGFTKASTELDLTGRGRFLVAVKERST